MKFVRTIETATAVDVVSAYLSDFTTTTEWDPGTVTTELVGGDGGEGTRYRNVSKFLGRETELTYIVVEREPGTRIALVGSNKTVTAHDTMTFEPQGTGTRVTYEAEFEFQGLARFVAPLLAPALGRLADKAEDGMQSALDGLTTRDAPQGPPGRR
jgi:hypothetical protein